MNKFYSYFLIFVLVSGFATFSIQEAHAAAIITITAKTGDSATGQSTATNKIHITWSEGVTIKTGETVTDNDWTISTGQTVTSVSHTNGTTTSVLTLSGSLATNATPDVTYADNGNTGSIVSSDDGLDSPVTTANTATDGLKPTVSVSFSPSSPSLENTITATITWSESVTTFVVGDISVSAGTLSRFSGTGSSYTVTWDLTGLDVGNSYTFTITQNSATDGSANTGPGSAASSSFNRSGSGSGSGCNGDCEEPTLGIDEKGNRVVSDGFTYNGYAVDVERFFTPYPLITAQVGKQNIAEFKIYENRGPYNVKHFTFAFGLDKGDVISQSKAKIELERDYDGTETVTVYDPENALDNVKVTTSLVSCSTGSDLRCLDVKIQHTFRAPLDFNIVATDVWDFSRQSWQNYYNHGIEVVGDSLNPPQEFNGIAKGHIYHLTETGKNTAVDDFGNNWTLKYDVWEKDFVKNERIPDTASVFTRTHSDFTDAKISEYEKATTKLLVLCPTCLDSFASLDDPKSFLYPERIDRANDPKLQYALKSESERATKILEYILHPELYYR